MNKIIVRHSSILVNNYEIGDCEDLERSLSVWNDIYYKFEPKGFYYNETRRELILPRGLDLGYLERKLNRPIEMEYEHDKCAKAIYKLKVEPRSELQVKAISYLIGEGEFTYTRKYSQQSLNLDTGDGKTYCLIASLTFLQLKSMIITHIDSIKTQWIKSFTKMTNLDERSICNISGSNVIDKLFKADNLPYKVYLVNHATIKQYAKKHGWDKIRELFQKLEIGVKVYDEAHLEFASVIKIDAHTNVKKTFYLTANFERSFYNENKIFSLAFKNIPKYGIETRNEKRKHIVYVSVTYNSKPSVAQQSYIKGIKGFDKNKYIDYQIEKGMIFDVIKWTIDYFSKFDGKMLLLTSKIDSSFIMTDWLKENYPDKRVLTYNSKVSDDDKAKVHEVDIISSTPKSFSTGVDVPGLRVNIMTEPYSSKITANQVAGRLREYGPTDYTFHVELTDVGFKRVADMQRKRLNVFKDKCVKILNIKYE